MKKLAIYSLSLLLFACGNDNTTDDEIIDGELVFVGTEYDDLKLSSLNDRVSYSIGFTSAGEMKEFFESAQYKSFFNKASLKEGFYTGIESSDTSFADGCDQTLATYFGNPGTFDTTSIRPNEASNCLGFLRGIEIKYSLTKRGIFSQLSPDFIKKGFKDALYNYDTLIPLNEQVAVISDFFGAIIKSEGEAFLEENKQKKGVTTMENGLQIETIKMGNGAKPTLNSTVSVYYTLSLINGQQVESNAQDPEPISFPLSNVIQGWQQGLQLMQKGGKYKLYVPYELGYGHQGSNGIQPYSALIFEIELVDFK